VSVLGAQAVPWASVAVSPGPRGEVWGQQVAEGVRPAAGAANDQQQLAAAGVHCQQVGRPHRLRLRLVVEDAAGLVPTRTQQQQDQQQEWEKHE